MQPGEMVKPVYPRVGGGNEPSERVIPADGGLSPRGRGKRTLRTRHPGGRRSIPAWAGETQGQAVETCDCQLYPRVGGGNSPCKSAAKSISGLSPRGRGKPRVVINGVKAAGSIPAWAGETPIPTPMEARW